MISSLCLKVECRKGDGDGIQDPGPPISPGIAMPSHNFVVIGQDEQKSNGGGHGKDGYHVHNEDHQFQQEVRCPVRGNKFRIADQPFRHRGSLRGRRYGAVTMHAVPLERSAHSIQTIL